MAEVEALKLTTPAYRRKKVPQSIKENVVLTFELLGGVTEYAEWAKRNKDKFYDHWIKLLPAEIKAEVSMTHDFTSILEAARNRANTVPHRSMSAIADGVKDDVTSSGLQLEQDLVGELVERRSIDVNNGGNSV